MATAQRGTRLSARILVIALGLAGPAVHLAVGCGGDDSLPAFDASGFDATRGPDAMDTGSPEASTDTGSPPDSATDSARADASDAGSCPGAFDGSLDDATVGYGRGLVMAYGCAGCHQAPEAGLLSGRTTSLQPDAAIYPKNLTPDPQTGLGCWTDPEIVNAILHGIDDQGMMLCVMPRFAMRGMDAGGAEAVATYLRSIPAVNRVIPDSICPAMGDAGAGDAADAGD